MFAVDYLLYTLAESGSTLGGGWAVDALGWGTRRLSSALAALAAGFTVGRRRVAGGGGGSVAGAGKVEGRVWGSDGWGLGIGVEMLTWACMHVGGWRQIALREHWAA